MTTKPITTEQVRQTGALDVPDAAGYLGVGRTLAYEACRTGQWPTIRVGRRLLVPSGWLLRVAGHDPEAAA